MAPSIPYLGYVQVRVDDAKADTNALVFVCPDTPYSQRTPLLIGTNVIPALCDVEGTCKTNKQVRQLDTVLQAYRMHRTLYEDGDGHVGSVEVLSKRAIVIRPGETVTVRGRCRSKGFGEEYPALLETPVALCSAVDCVTVPSVLVTVPRFKRPQVKVPVMNLTGSPITLKHRTHLADLYVPKWIRPVGTSRTPDGSDDVCASHQVESMSATVTHPAHLQLCHIGTDLPGPWDERVKRVLSQFADVFSRDDLDVGKTSAVKHRILLIDDTPFKERSRPIAARDLDDARKHIQDLLDSDIIHPSNSPYASAIVLVRKKNGSLRLTVDFRKLNKRTIKDAYSLPRIDDSFAKLSGARWFSVMDLKSGYYQVEMEPEDQAKTAFISPLGFYEFSRLPQGICNSPATFQRLMDRCMGTLNLREVLTFLDDIIVFSKTLEDHETYLIRVLRRLREFGLKLNPQKCSFFCKSVSYLGHRVSEEGVSCDPTKVESVRSWPRPDNMKELRSFLGFASYYRKFVRGFSSIAQPLNVLLQGYTKLGADKRLKVDRVAVKRPFYALWTAQCEEAFVALKAELVQAPVLALADSQLPYELHTDASGSGLGAALYQTHDGVLRPVAYASRSLSTSEANYPAHKLEFLALKWAVCQKFHDFLYGAKFRVITDNNPLTYVLTSARVDAMGQRWLAALSAYDFDIKYRAGHLNVDADSLSRRPHLSDMGVDWVQERHDRRIASLLNNTRPLHGELSDIVSATAIIAALAEGDGIPAIQCLPVTSETVLRGNVDENVRSMPTLSTDEQRDAQLADPAIARLRKLVNEHTLSSVGLRKRETKEVVAMMRGGSKYCFRQGVLFKRSIISGQAVLRLVVPLSLRQLVYEGIHDQIGHLGSERGVALARTRFYWYRMEQDITAYCKKCTPCILRKTPLPRAATMSSLESSGPMDLLCIDFLKVEPDKYNRVDILVITDHFTRFARAIPTRNQSARAVADALWNGFFLDFGFPRRLHSDRGATFTGKLVKQLCALTGVRGSLTTPYHPQGNSQVERFNRSLLSMLGCMTVVQKQEWSKHVKYLVHAYNCTQHESTGYSPFYLMFARHPRLQVDWLFDVGPNDENRAPDLNYVQDVRASLADAYQAANERALAKATRNKVRYDRRVRQSGLSVGGRVQVRNVALRGKQKLANRWLPDVYIVVKQQGGENSPVYVISREDGKKGQRTLHRNLLLPCDMLPLAVRTGVCPRGKMPARRRVPARADSSDDDVDQGPPPTHMWWLESSDDDGTRTAGPLAIRRPPPVSPSDSVASTTDDDVGEESPSGSSSVYPRPRRPTRPPRRLIDEM